MSEPTIVWLVPMIISLVCLFVLVNFVEDFDINRLTFLIFLFSSIFPILNIVTAIIFLVLVFLCSSIGESVAMWVEGRYETVMEWLDKPLIDRKD